MAETKLHHIQLFFIDSQSTPSLNIHLLMSCRPLGVHINHFGETCICQVESVSLLTPMYIHQRKYTFFIRIIWWDVNAKWHKRMSLQNWYLNSKKKKKKTSLLWWHSLLSLNFSELFFNSEIFFSNVQWRNWSQSFMTVSFFLE